MLRGRALRRRLRRLLALPLLLPLLLRRGRLLGLPRGRQLPALLLVPLERQEPLLVQLLEPGRVRGPRVPGVEPGRDRRPRLGATRRVESAVSRHGLVEHAQIQLLPSEHRPPRDGDILVFLHELHVLHPERLVLALVHAQLQLVHRLHPRLERERRRVLIERDRPPFGRDDPA